jgi:hypothetical protein
MVDQERMAVVYPGQRVITSAGDVVTVAMVRGDGVVLAWRGNSPWPLAVTVRGDAWGGEADQAVGLAA